MAARPTKKPAAPGRTASRSVGRGGADLRRRLLDAARRQLVQHGYVHLTMRRVAARVGVTATAIYLHFKDKDDLIHALIDEGMEALQLALEASDERAAPPRARLEGLCRAMIEFGVSNPEYYEIMFLLHPQRMSRYPTDKYRRARHNLERFADAVDPFVKKGDPLMATHALWCLLHGIISLRLAGRLDSSLDPDEFTDEAVTRGLRMLGA
ncbi:MAG: TetR/AcrR family transcriptional regulator [Planctomycetota bacterium]|nr:TetR/AcrR family transcriptional regulator [Planctomycetota bacterium]